jgi:hypothetical protein
MLAAKAAFKALLEAQMGLGWRTVWRADLARFY